MHALLYLLAASTGATAIRPWSAPAPGFSADLNELAARLEPESGAHVAALMRINYARSDDIQPGGPGSNDLGGFTWDNLSLLIEGQVGAFDVRVTTESASGSVLVAPLIQDAFAHTRVSEHLGLTLGQFRPPLLASALIEPEGQLFILRTTDSQLWFDSRDPGTMLDGRYEQLGWALAVQNGADGAADELALSGRLSVDALGRGPWEHEGALGAGDDTRLTLGVGYRDDASATADGDVLAVDARATSGPFAAQFEWLDYGDDGLYGVFANTSPWSASASYVFIPDKYEVGVRWQDLDDDVDTQALTVGVNRYVEGHDCKWQVNYIDVDADGGDTSTFAVGLTVGI